jgi:Family of unknown function (DUF6427)
MLSLFKHNTPLGLLLLLVCCVLLRLSTWFIFPVKGMLQLADSGVLYVGMMEYMPSIGWANYLLATILVYIQALMVNNIVVTHKLSNDKTLYPALFYVIIGSALPDFHYLSAPLVATTFLILLLQKLFSTYNKKADILPVFDLGFWLSIAALFYPPAIWLAFIAYIGLASIGTFKIKDQLIFISGLGVPFILVATYHYWNDSLPHFVEMQFGSLFQMVSFSWIIDINLLMKITLMTILVLITFVSIATYYYKRLINVQKYISILYWFLLATILLAMFRTHPSLDMLFLIVPSLSIFIALRFETIKLWQVSEMLLLLLIASILFIQFAPTISL